MKILEANIIDWINIESRRSLKQGQRFNFHFDPRVSPEQMISKIIDIHNNGNRSFLPFIRRQDRQRKFRYHSKEGIAALDSEMPPKPIISHKIRPIMYASNTDALIYSFYSTLIGSKYEDFLHKNNLSSNVSAYRSEQHKSNIHYAGEVFAFITTAPNLDIYTFDVSGFFDNLRHVEIKNGLLKIYDMEVLPKDIYSVMRSIVRYDYVDLKTLTDLFGRNGRLVSPICSKDEFVKVVRPIIKKNSNSYGIPQGSPISGMLANIAMIEADAEIAAFVSSHKGIYRRYSDDIFIAIPSSENIDAASQVAIILKRRGLTLNGKKSTLHYSICTSKVKIINSDPTKHAPLQYLGFIFDGYSSRIRSSTIAKRMRKSKRIGRKLSIASRASSVQVPTIKRYANKGKSYGRDYYLLRTMALIGSKDTRRQVNRIIKTSAKLARPIEKI